MLIVLEGKEIWDNNAIFTSGVRFYINSVSTYILLKTRDVTTGMKLLKNVLIYVVIIDL